MNGVQKNILQKGEPAFGSIYGDEEIIAVNKIIKESIKPEVGFRAAKEIQDFENKFLSLTKNKYAIAFNGAGSALDLVLKALDLKPEDEIISCAINFAGTHLSIIGSGAKLVLCEPDPETINIDPYDVEKKLTKRTRAIVVTHMNGLSADTDLLKEIINKNSNYKNNNPKIICDSARSCGTTYKGEFLGQGVWATIFSFQSKKIITTLGEGGMVVTNDKDLSENLQDHRSFGRGRNWGSNYKMTKVQAAVGVVQLKKLEMLVKNRRLLAKERSLALARFKEINIQKDTNYSESCYYLYTLILPSNLGGKKRDQLMAMMKNRYGVGSVVGNPPTYKSNELIQKITRGQSFPIAEDLGNRIICLVIHPQMTKETNQYLINSFIKSYEKIFRQ